MSAMNDVKNAMQQHCATADEIDAKIVQQVQQVQQCNTSGTI
jgi:hypothetical protein